LALLVRLLAGEELLLGLTRLVQAHLFTLGAVRSRRVLLRRRRRRLGSGLGLRLIRLVGQLVDRRRRRRGRLGGGRLGGGRGLRVERAVVILHRRAAVAVLGELVALADEAVVGARRQRPAAELGGGRRRQRRLVAGLGRRGRRGRGRCGGGRRRGRGDGGGEL